MSKRAQKLQRNLKVVKITDEQYEKQITKKQFISSLSSAITSTSPNESRSISKENVKSTLKELKNIKNLKKIQEQIQMKIENENIKKHVQGLIEKFDPPNCINCPKRRADRVCINKECGVDRYMQLICGKCHIDEHQKCTTKPEIDIQEYFIKLATFMNEQKYDEKQSKNVQRLDLNNLETIFDNIDQFRNMLSALRSMIQNEIEGYCSPQEMHANLQNSITKALSLCEYDNIQEQLVNVKKAILFKNNQFHSNDVQEKFISFQRIITDFDQRTIETSKQINKSFLGKTQFDLNELKFLVSPNLTLEKVAKPFQIQDNEITIISGSTNSQYYMNYTLDKQKKYKFRFRFESFPQQNILVGIMPKLLVNQSYICDITDQYFCKRFLCNSPSIECSRIIKGEDLSLIPQQGMQIEMRIDFENDQIDFYDYPKINNINANHLSQKFLNQDYVIALAFYTTQAIVIESFEELSSLENLY